VEYSYLDNLQQEVYYQVEAVLMVRLLNVLEQTEVFLQAVDLYLHNLGPLLYQGAHTKALE